MAWDISPEDLSYQPRHSRVPTCRSEYFREIFDGLAGADACGKEHLERYVQHLVRRNFQRLTILQAASTLKLFLGFLNNNGSWFEGLSRLDLEAFIEAVKRGTLLNLLNN